MKTHRFALACTFALLALPALPREASAQSHGDAAAAESLFRSAREAAKAHDYATACPQFAESARLDRAPGTLLNLADCEEHLEHYATAWVHFVEAAEGFPHGDSRIPYAKKRAEAALGHAAKLTLKLAPGVPSTVQAWRDDVAVGAAQFGHPLPIDPGEHVVRVRSAEGTEQRMPIKLGASESMELTLSPPTQGFTAISVEPTASASPVNPAPAPTPYVQNANILPPPEGHDRGTSSSDTRTAGYVVGGIGIASLVVGGVAGVMALGQASTFKSHCDNRGCDPQGMDAASSGKTLATVSTIGIAAGVVGAGVGAFLILRSGPKTTKVSATPREGGGTLLLSHDF